MSTEFIEGMCMSVTIREMTHEEYEQFYAWSVQNHPAELVEQARKEIAAMLPDGLETEHNQLMTIVAEGENVGFLWTLHEKTDGKMQSFLCDFAVWEQNRRKGYGRAALAVAEENAKAAGCVESVLFVADDNTVARAFYETCGYQVLRRKDYGQYMIKQLKASLV